MFDYYDDHGKEFKFGEATSFELDKWYHLAVVWHRTEEGSVQTYVNGALEMSGPGGTHMSQHPTDLFIGSYQGRGNFFDGYMSEIAIFDRALVPAEVKKIYEKGIQLKSPVVVSSLTVGKILYHPRDKGSARVRVKNVSTIKQTVDLTLQLVSALDDRREVYLQSLKLPAKSSLLREITFDFVDEEYGCELQAIVRKDGAIIARHGEFFSVTDNLWKVCLGGADVIQQSALYSEQRIEEEMSRARQMYCNWFEKFFWAPDDWGDMTPEPGATWLSSQGGRYENTEKLQFAIKTAHKQGIKAITYGKAMAYSHVAWEIVRRKPDWFLMESNGIPAVMPTDIGVYRLDHWRDYDVLADVTSGKRHGSYEGLQEIRCFPDTRRLDTLDHGINEIIESSRLLGWDGVRFDSSGFRAYWIDGTKDGRDGVNIRNMKRLKKRLWKALPNYLIGHNTRNPPYISKDGREYPLEPADPIAHEVREALAGGCLWMGEAIRVWRNGSVRYTSWSQFAHDERRCISTIKHYGGNFCYSYGGGKGDQARDLYRFLIGTMNGAHQYGNTHVSLTGSSHWGHFLTRWSDFFWGERLRPFKEADQWVSVTSDRSLWWQGFANERIVSPRRRYVIVNMLNPPPDDEIAKMHNELPEPVENVELTVTIPRNEKLDKVYFIAPGTPNRADPLNPVGHGKTKRVSVPKFEIWVMVVLELTGRYTVPQVPPTFTEPMSAAEKKELAFWQEKRIKIHTADDLLNPSPYEPIPEKLHLAKTAADDTPPGDRTFGGDPGLDILLLRGLHHYSYRLPEAIRTVAPKARITSVTGKDAPRDYDSFFQYDIVILVDYHGHLKDAARQALSDLVAAGGKLMVFGGLGTGGLRYYQNIPLPVKVRSQRDIYRLPKPLTLGAHKNDPFVGRPLVYYFHAAQPKRDAIVRWWAGEIPVLLERKVGKGKTLLFVGTVLGEAQAEDQTPFWESKA